MKTLKVIWSPKAKISYFKILDYLEEKWTDKEIALFIDRTEEVIQLIVQNPSIYPYSKKANMHKAILF